MSIPKKNYYTLRKRGWTWSAPVQYSRNIKPVQIKALKFHVTDKQETVKQESDKQSRFFEGKKVTRSNRGNPKINIKTRRKVYSVDCAIVWKCNERYFLCFKSIFRFPFGAITYITTVAYENFFFKTD